MNLPQNLTVVIKHACTLILIILPVFWVYMALDTGYYRSLVFDRFPLEEGSVEAWQLYGSLCVAFLPNVVTLWGVNHLRKTFILFQGERFFSLEAIQGLKCFSLSLCLFAVLQPLSMALNSVLLSFNHSPGNKLLVVNLGSADLKALFVGGIFWVICFIFLGARKIEEENQQFI